MSRFSQYYHTIRYLKPIQVYGRIWFRLHKPKVHISLPLPVRKCTGIWQPPPAKAPFMTAPDGFRFLGEEHALESPADWNHPDREKLWLYHLHYFDDLNAIGAAERHAWHKALIGRWIAENPVGAGNGWEPYPLSLRIVNWIQWSLAGNNLDDGALKSLAMQAQFLSRRLEWHILGNHLLANAKALIFAGFFFEGPEAAGWLDKGVQIFTKQLHEQVLADGGHFERSPMYQAQVLTDILDVMNIRRVYPEASPLLNSQKGLLAEKARRMLDWLNVMSHPDGAIVLFNDAAFREVNGTEALIDYAGRLGIVASARNIDDAASSVRITRLDASGYIRVDSGIMTAFLDAAPIGPDYLPGHAHADTLTFELSLGHQRVIVDSGVSQYGEGPERLRQRGTAAHNTVTIDGQDSSEVWGGFRVARRAYPKELRIQASEGVISCAHDGYNRLPGKPVHRREWRFRPGGLQIHDTVDGKFDVAIGRLHFHPEIIATPDDQSCGSGTLTLSEGQKMNWHIAKGRGRICKTTWHPEFGVTLPNQCLEIHFNDRETVVDLSWE